MQRKVRNTENIQKGAIERAAELQKELDVIKKEANLRAKIREEERTALKDVRFKGVVSVCLIVWIAVN